MKLFDGGMAPNPRRVRIYLAEKGIDVPLEPVDMGALEHTSERVSKRNALKRLPVLELDDGTILTESIAICRYFEELNPEPPLFGTTALERAQVEMWQRQIELHFLYPTAQAFRHTHPAMKDWEVPQVEEWGIANRGRVADYLRLMDQHLADREFLITDRFTVADITAMVAAGFMKPARIAMPDDVPNVTSYVERMQARPSYKA
ncbi:glutathione S-transferase family protein [Notoacmeibacter sp. MSK16QG-6]|uniref:glutathione S-transferase family protein n=1 Tax=Notoacmeibacter sp. MSK16QG-6 TaxID=2957982 RepID=UPI00209F4D94|nr:glutathione S-transferase [Notoacmeibacter sp. MSK16QG-6]MCP1199491.1 glutathione S-transferase [Notoacmeibacter sp. MSK16QG-6]